MKHFTAPWGKTLRWSSAALVVMSGLLLIVIPNVVARDPHLPAILLPAVLLGTLPFMVRGYEVTEDAIFILRPLWKTRLDRGELTSAEALPDALRGTFRTFGNGGAFSFTGWFWKRSLGHFHAYANDPFRTVVLRFGRKTVVLSPADPADFVKSLARP